MFKTQPNNPNIANKYIKHDSHMLNQVYGTDDLVPYWIADMEFPIAPAITEALQGLVNRETYSYEFDSETVFKAISKWNKKRHGLNLDANNFVQVPGVLTAIALLIREFSEVGEGVLIQTPVYHQFGRIIESAGRTVINNTLKIVDGTYVIDYENFEYQLQTGAAKIVLLCNPHNPVGRVWKREELEKLVEIAKKYQVLIISDEVHADIIFDESTFTGISSFDYENSISIIGSPAKNFGLNSISNGYIYSNNQELKDKISATVHSMSLDHGNALTTYATIAAYEQGGEWFNQFLDYTQKNRNWILNFVENNLPQIKAYKPEGTNQIWFDFTGLNLEASELKALLAKEAKLGLTPGTWFKEPNENYYRMNFAAPKAQIEESFLLLQSVIKKIQK